MEVKTDQGVRRLQQRTLGAFITRWDQILIEEQYAFAAEVIKVFGQAMASPGRSRTVLSIRRMLDEGRKALREAG